MRDEGNRHGGHAATLGPSIQPYGWAFWTRVERASYRKGEGYRVFPDGVFAEGMSRREQRGAGIESWRRDVNEIRVVEGAEGTYHVDFKHVPYYTLSWANLKVQAFDVLGTRTAIACVG